MTLNPCTQGLTFLAYHTLQAQHRRCSPSDYSSRSQISWVGVSCAGSGHGGGRLSRSHRTLPAPVHGSGGPGIAGVESADQVDDL